MLGMGPVGQRFADALERAGRRVVVYDPLPDRCAGHRAADSAAGAVAAADWVLSAVPAAACVAAAQAVGRAAGRDTHLVDISSAEPKAKRSAARHLPDGRYVDATLLDAITADIPLVCLSGPRQDTAAAALAGLGLEIASAGPEVGTAAQVKLLRSLVMKPLEVLTIELMAQARDLDPEGIALWSVERSLRTPYRTVAHDFLTSNRLHAGRRAAELDAAAAAVAAPGSASLYAPMADGLTRLAERWRAPGAPDPDAPAERLLAHLSPDGGRGR
ncbi:hypothetical protein GCM10012280_40670 [Wenjunlia tyrosinilytica]|uniref:6-phosphogluconate dehydrogenase NADP-binding domain-containing protein n=1 Tax=Wenjunlia tyrosinilytica TaxID=1544741 RepID=A0A918E053_9ACTN|nr:hypothetical protein GCM10012280_40670 [Wenjunlia tyrosinilytica]